MGVCNRLFLCGLPRISVVDVLIAGSVMQATFLIFEPGFPTLGLKQQRGLWYLVLSFGFSPVFAAFPFAIGRAIGLLLN
jgi:hypothetical protein